MQGYAVSEATANNPSAVPEPLSPCTATVQNGQCVCLFAVTHFSTFAVGDAATIDPSSSSGALSTPSASSPNIGAIAGGIVGGILLVVISAFVVMKMRQRSRYMAGESEITELAGKEMATTPQPL